jgi:hypothetical protein
MTGLLYALEDHFDAVAAEREGQVSGRVSRSISSLCAIAGDVRRHVNRAEGGAPIGRRPAPGRMIAARAARLRDDPFDGHA